MVSHMVKKSEDLKKIKYYCKYCNRPDIEQFRRFCIPCRDYAIKNGEFPVMKNTRYDKVKNKTFTKILNKTTDKMEDKDIG